ncbi:MAG: hypothetical protein KC503_32290 [Myxococcales bacterium]|nr:hypothetical protein [Myxococcales bacterium]
MLFDPNMFALDTLGLLAVLEDVAALEPAATGALTYGPDEAPVGAVLVESGQTCWAAAAGMRPLTRILCERFGLARDVLENRYQRCREEGRPLGECLVDEALLSVEQLREALLEHTANALVVLSGARERAPRWREHRNSRYDARFSFNNSELLLAVASQVVPALQVRAWRVLERITVALHSAAFVADRGYLLPIWLQGDWELRDLLTLGAWAADTIELSSHATGEPTELVAATDERRRGVVAWRDPAEPRLVYGAMCFESTALGRLLSRYREIGSIGGLGNSAGGNHGARHAPHARA